MSDCNETIRELETFLDGELTDETRERVRGHLGGCVDCLQAFDFEAEVKAALRRKCSNDPMPAGLVERIKACFDTDLSTLDDDTGAS